MKRGTGRRAKRLSCDAGKIISARSSFCGAGSAALLLRESKNSNCFLLALYVCHTNANGALDAKRLFFHLRIGVYWIIVSQSVI